MSGPGIYVPDVNTSERGMSWLTGHNYINAMAMAIGKLVNYGGISGRSSVTGRSVLKACDVWQDKAAIVQQFGNVGSGCLKLILIKRLDNKS